MRWAQGLPTSLEEGAFNPHQHHEVIEELVDEIIADAEARYHQDGTPVYLTVADTLTDDDLYERYRDKVRGL